MRYLFCSLLVLFALAHAAAAQPSTALCPSGAPTTFFGCYPNLGGQPLQLTDGIPVAQQGQAVISRLAGVNDLQAAIVGNGFTSNGPVSFGGVVTFSAGVAGTLSGNIIQLNSANTYGSTITMSGSSVPTYMGNFIANWAGSSTRTDNTGAAAFHIGASSDTTNFSVAGGTRDELLISSNYGGGAFNGFRQGVMVQMNFNSASTLTLAAGGGTGLASKVVPSANFGGSAGSYFGSFFGMNPWTDCKTGATFLSQCVGGELDGALQAGASASNFTLLQAVLTSDHATHGTLSDNGYALVAQVGAAVGLGDGQVVGSYQAQWPIDGNGYLYKVETGSNYGTVAATAAGGIDLLQAAFSGSGLNGGGFAFRSVGASTSVNATAIDSSGNIKIGGEYISATNSAMTIGAPLFSFAGISSIVSGGTNYSTNDVVDDGYGNIFTVTASGGVVSAVTLKYRAEGRLAAPAVSSIAFNTLTAGAARGSGLTVTENAWTQGGNDVVAGLGSNLPSLSVTTGFFHLPFTNATSGAGGIPTGTPANTAGPACVWNDVTFVLNCYSPSAGAWKHAAFSAGAG